MKSKAPFARIQDLRLVCPVCGDTDIAFHSETVLLFGSAEQKTSILTCKDSHIFLVPNCSLAQAHPRNGLSAGPAVVPDYAQMLQGEWQNRMRTILKELRALMGKSRKLRNATLRENAELRRMRDALIAEGLTALLENHERSSSGLSAKTGVKAQSTLIQ